MRAHWTLQPMETARLVRHRPTLVSESLAAGHGRVYKMNIQLRVSTQEVYTFS